VRVLQQKRLAPSILLDALFQNFNVSPQSHTRATRKITLSVVWTKYVTERKKFWSEQRLKNSEHLPHVSGEKRKRNNKVTESGLLAWLSNSKLADLT
jgi:hypothetical protein